MYADILDKKEVSVCDVYKRYFSAEHFLQENILKLGDKPEKTPKNIPSTNNRRISTLEQFTSKNGDP